MLVKEDALSDKSIDSALEVETGVSSNISVVHSTFQSGSFMTAVAFQKQLAPVVAQLLQKAQVHVMN